MTWYLRTKYSGNPNAKIVKDTYHTFVKLPDGTKVPPGTYEIEPGKTVVFQATVKNEGATGYCKVEIYDKKNRNTIAKWSGTLGSGMTQTISQAVVFRKDMDVIMVASAVIDGRWAQTDYWG